MFHLVTRLCKVRAVPTDMSLGGGDEDKTLGAPLCFGLPDFSLKNYICDLKLIIFEKLTPACFF
jgi:hypothetical protein